MVKTGVHLRKLSQK